MCGHLFKSIYEVLQSRRPLWWKLDFLFTLDEGFSVSVVDVGLVWGMVVESLSGNLLRGGSLGEEETGESPLCITLTCEGNNVC